MSNETGMRLALEQAGGEGVENGKGDYVGLDQQAMVDKLKLRIDAALKKWSEANTSDGIYELIRVIDEEKRKIREVYEVPRQAGNLTPEATAAFKTVVRESVRTLTADMLNFTKGRSRADLRKMIDNMKASVEKMKAVPGIYEPLD